MTNNTNRLFCLVFIILCFNTVTYQQVQSSGSMEDNPPGDSIEHPALSDFPGYTESIEKPIDNPLTLDAEFEGEFKTRAFFPGGTGYIYGPDNLGETLITDPAGTDPYNTRNIHEWVTYDEIKDDGTLNKEMYWRALSTVTCTWPNDTQYFYLRERNHPYEPSKIYSPVFTEDYEIAGRVYWLSWYQLDNNPAFNRSIQLGYRQSLYLFNPADPLNPTLLAQRTETRDVFSIWSGQRSHYADITGTVTIPAGYRLRWDIQVRFSSIPEEGSFVAYSGYQYSGGGSTTWTIDDANDTYDNTYNINNVTRMAGIQLLMRSKAYPDINMTGATNGVVYYAPQNVTIDVTAGSISYYQWNSGGWTLFVDSIITSIPELHGYNYLNVKTSDPIYNNTKTTSYTFGYDESITNVVLNSPLTNGSSIKGGTTIDLDVYSVDTTEYRWDGGTWSSLWSPYDITAPSLNGEHILTVKTTDFYSTETVDYIFYLDSSVPIIQLFNVINDTEYAPGKVIEFNITDNTAIHTVLYSWDSDPDDSLAPTQGTIYQTILPDAPGNHYLVMKANDTYGYYTEKYYEFRTDDEIFLVELAELRNNSYYLGNEEVIVTVQKSNGTIFYVWDSGTIKQGTSISSQLALTGIDAIPNTPGPHNLTIITYELNGDNTSQIFYFNFIVDQEAPIIDGSIITNYNDKRFENNIIMEFTITDNYTSIGQLTVLIAINELANQTLNNPFELNLLPFSDDTYILTIYVFDIAGNWATQTIVFYIDTQAPDIDINIPSEIVHFGKIYIATGAEIDVTIDDSDPMVDTFYTWDGGINTTFTDTITMSYGDNSATLLIYANDTLGHISVYPINLIIDNISPELYLTSPAEYIEINRHTDLVFLVDEENIETVTLIQYYWDKLPFYYGDTTYDASDSFTLNIPALFFDGPGAYKTDDNAIVTIEVFDVLGNFETETYTFTIDRDAPLPGLFLDDNGTYIELDDEISFTVLGETPVIYKNDTNDDIASLEWEWIGEEIEGSLDFTEVYAGIYLFVVNVSEIDGEHQLKVKLTDNTTSNIPNSVVYIFNITVNDIDVDVIGPGSWEDEEGYLTYHHRMNYTDSFTFSVIVTDTLSGEIIPELLARNTSTAYDFAVSITNTSTLYECSITALDVTNGLEPYIFFEFYLADGGSQKLKLFLIIDKKQGSLEVLDQTELIVQYDEDIIVFIEMEDHLGQNVSVVYIEANSINTSFETTSNINEYSFSYSTHGLVKGNNTIRIYTESSYYYAILEGVFAFEFTVTPLPMFIDVQVSNQEVLQNTDFIISARLTFENGTGYEGQLLNFYVYVYSFENTSGEVSALIPTNYTSYTIINRTTNFEGNATIPFTMSDDIDYILVAVTYEGGDFVDLSYSEIGEKIIKILPPGFPSWLLYTLIGGSLFAILIISFIVYRVTRGKPFEEVMEGITIDEINDRYEELSPGVILTIFDQRKGPIPLIASHSLDTTRYLGRMQIGVENFLLKIADQAYSSLGFEEHDVGRRVGSIILPTEKMIGFVHGIQLPNKMARGGFENLSLIVLTDSEYGNLLLNYQDYVYDEIDTIADSLKAKKPLKQVEDILRIIRHKSVKIMLTAEKVEKKKS